MKVIKFVKPCYVQSLCYNPGEIAGFEVEVADELIKQEFAVAYKEGK